MNKKGNSLKLKLLNGLMTVNGRDYCFYKASGSVKWWMLKKLNWWAKLPDVSQFPFFQYFYTEACVFVREIKNK